MVSMALLPECSRPVSIDQITREWRTVEVVASDAECEALARRFGVIEIVKLSAQVRLRTARRLIECRGELAATVVQSCVVSLEPIAGGVAGEIAVTFRGDAEPGEGGEATFGLDDPEPLEGDIIDVGELVAQHLALHLDQYPRIEDAVVQCAPGRGVSAGFAPDDARRAGPAGSGARPGARPGDAGEEARREPPRTPFAELARLKNG